MKTGTDEIRQVHVFPLLLAFEVAVEPALAGVPAVLVLPAVPDLESPAVPAEPA